MSEIQRVKINNDRIINLVHIIEAIKDSSTGAVSIFLSDSIGNEETFPVNLTGDEAKAFWEFYSNIAFGCIDLTLLFPLNSSVPEENR